MVFSASWASARELHDNPYHFIQRQGIWAILSVVAMLFMAGFDYKKVEKLTIPITILSIALLIVVLLGPSYSGSKRWINLGFTTFQPSELAKLAIILLFAKSLSKNYKSLKFFWKGLMPYLAVIGVFAGLLMLEPHLSGTIVIGLTGVSILFAAGAQIKHFILLSVPAAAGVAALAISEPYRLARITSFVNPFADKLGDGWQIIQSLYAIGSGGLFGVGLGRSRQKFLYIPEPQNDFIFSILCEELGLIGAAVVIMLFIMLIYRGISIAINAPDRFSCLMATGITALIGIQVVFNIAVVTSSMPVTGIPLPFFSAGGTALFINMVLMGILLNISRYNSKTNNQTNSV